jgi:hypothetical protein
MAKAKKKPTKAGEKFKIDMKPDEALKKLLSQNPKGGKINKKT